MKRCPECSQDLPLDAFSRDKSKRDGRTTYCKPCQKARHAAWTDRNREHVNAAGRLRSHRPDVRAKQTAYLRRWQREKYRNDPEYRARVRAAQAARYAANPEPQKAAAKAWSAANPDSMIEATHRRRARLRAATVGPVSRTAVMERDNWICWICEEPTETDGPRARRPSLDHVQPLSEGGSHTEDNLRCAHVGCNSSRYNRGRSRKVLANAH